MTPGFSKKKAWRCPTQDVTKKDSSSPQPVQLGFCTAESSERVQALATSFFYMLFLRYLSGFLIHVRAPRHMGRNLSGLSRKVDLSSIEVDDMTGRTMFQIQLAGM